MPKFFVTLEETVHYDVEVEADTADTAAEIAADVWADSADPTHDFCGQGRGVEAINVEQH